MDFQVFPIDVDTSHPQTFAFGAPLPRRAVALRGLIVPLLARTADEDVGFAIQSHTVRTDRIESVDLEVLFEEDALLLAVDIRTRAVVEDLLGAAEEVYFGTATGLYRPRREK